MPYFHKKTQQYKISTFILVQDSLSYYPFHQVNRALFYVCLFVRLFLYFSPLDVPPYMSLVDFQNFRYNGADLENGVGC